MRRHLAITGVSLSGPIPGWGPVMSTFGEMLLGGDLSSQCLSETHDTRRLRICRSQVLGEKCDPSVIAEIPVSWPPINGSETARTPTAHSGKSTRHVIAPDPLRYSAYSSLCAGEEGML